MCVVAPGAFPRSPPRDQLSSNSDLGPRFLDPNFKKCKKWTPGGQKIFLRSRIRPSRRAGFIFDVENAI